MADVKNVRIAVIDDHPLFREGLIHLLESEKNFQITAQADSEHTGMQILAASPIDFVILDLSLKNSSGLDLLKNIRISYPLVPVLILTMHDEEYYAERVRVAGANGFIKKEEDPELIIQAIKTILSGKTYFPSAPEKNANDPIQTLSDREFSVFDLISQGLGSKEISNKLNLSVKTIETHKEHIKTKLNQPGAAELLKFAIEWRRSSK